MPVAISRQLFAILSALVEERVGLHYGPDDQDVFAEKVSTRMVEAGFESPLDYYYYLRYDDPTGAEIGALVESLVVGETYLFREADALTSAIEHVVRPAVSARGHASIWCAASASGEEPVTMAMLLAEADLLDRCTLVASDVSTRALARAQAGVYGPRSARALEPSFQGGNPEHPRIAKRWLVREGDKLRVKPELASAIAYRRVNLIDTAAIAELGTFDLILCRNVLIYFSDETVRSVVRALAAALGDEGRLVLGASESLLRFGTLLRCEERGGAFFYARERA
jgi:chemotaxis protein methyltransferase CheR